MLLYLLRHADAEPQAPSDEERPLTAKGREQSTRVADFLAGSDFVPDLCLSSPYVRARQTAGAVAERLGRQIVLAPWLASGMEPGTCLEQLHRLRDRGHLLLVGHEPDLSHLASHLLGLPGRSQLRMRKASLLLLDLPVLRAAAATLEFLVPCKVM